MKTIRVRPVLVESRKYSIIHKFGDCLDTHSELQKWHGDARPIYQELILISLEDEKIEEGELVYKKDLKGNIYKHIPTTNTWYADAKKVIARQSQIPQEYIYKFIEQYNNGCVEDLEVEVDIKVKHNGIQELLEDEFYQNFPEDIPNCVFIEVPKLTNGFVTIVEKESITYTEEEVKQLLIARNKEFSTTNELFNSLLLKQDLDWFENNKKK